MSTRRKSQRKITLGIACQVESCSRRESFLPAVAVGQGPRHRPCDETNEQALPLNPAELTAGWRATTWSTQRPARTAFAVLAQPRVVQVAVATDPREPSCTTSARVVDLGTGGCPVSAEPRHMPIDAYVISLLDAVQMPLQPAGPRYIRHTVNHRRWPGRGRRPRRRRGPTCLHRH